MGLPGVKVGPLDPDATAGFGSVAAQNSARTLIRLHRQQFPQELLRQLVRPLDAARTKALDYDEVRSYLAGLTLANGDPVIPEGAELGAAAVRGSKDSGYVLTFTYRVKPSGRIGKWFAPYDAERLPSSYEAGEELTRIHEARERGIVAFDSEGMHNEVLRRQNAALREEVKGLRAYAEGRGEKPEQASEEQTGDLRDSTNFAGDNEDLRRENQELRARLAQLEALSAAQYGGVPTAGIDEAARGSVAAVDPPFDEYESLKADDLVKRLRDEGTSREEREAILRYERSHANRKTVVLAAEESLDAGD